MNLENSLGVLESELASARIVALHRTGIFLAAQDNLAMVRAYLDDGRTFLAAGDPVNALAAAFYAEGWLHCGAACGVFILATPHCLFAPPLPALPPEVSEKLREKATRYRRLLATARGAVRPAPEQGTALHGTADRVAVVAETYTVRGEMHIARGEEAAALACFSYGHGWIDAGVRAGLFAVTGSREIFTI